MEPFGFIKKAAVLYYLLLLAVRTEVSKSPIRE
jgi:hypothetical protein